MHIKNIQVRLVRGIMLRPRKIVGFLEFTDTGSIEGVIDFLIEAKNLPRARPSSTATTFIRRDNQIHAGRGAGHGGAGAKMNEG
jgi:hypothetical protein